MHKGLEESQPIGDPGSAGPPVSADLRSLIEQSARSFGLISQQMSQFQLSPEVRRAISTYNQLNKSVARFQSQFNMALKPYAFSASRFIQAGILYTRVLDIYDSNGLLYHYTFPNELIVGKSAVKEEWGLAVLDFYREEWHHVASQIESKVDHYMIPQASRETLKEGLEAHGYGLYRAVPRIVFPEIERVLVDKGYKFSSFKLVKDIKDLGSDLTLGDFPDAILGMPTWEMFVDHVYKRVETPAEVAHHQGHSVPNRHAAIHGKVNYDTQVQSLNAIFLVDFMVRLLPAVGFLNAGASGN